MQRSEVQDRSEQVPGQSKGGGTGRVAGAVAVFAEVLITLGVLLSLFVVYTLWWTNVVADHQAKVAGSKLRQQWTQQQPADSGAHPHPHLAVGDSVGFLYIPAIGKDYSVLIRMGTGTDILNEGVAGVYQDPYTAAMPWAKSGNFALAAHRDGHGAKFHSLDKVGKGDTVVVETSDTWYIYRIDNTLPQTSKYDTGVVAPIPESSGYTRPGRYITLTTCTPVYTSRYRMAVWGHLVRTAPVDAGHTPPPELR